MKIVATQGPGRYLLDCEIKVDGKPQGQIIDTRAGKIWPPMFIQAIIARGYWSDCDLSPEQTEALLAAVQPSSHACQ